MALYIVACGDNIADPVCNPCPEKELGDVRAIAMLKNSHSITDFTDEAQWEAAIEAKEVYVFPATRGTMTPSETLEAGFGDDDEELTSYTYELDVQVPEYFDNGPFMRDLKKLRGYKVLYKTETYIHISDVTAKFWALNPVSGGKKDGVYWQIKSKVTQDCPIIPEVGPENIFQNCYDVVVP